MLPLPLAHIVPPSPASPSGLSGWVVVASVVAATGLWCQHQLVLGGRIRLKRSVRSTIAVVVCCAVAATVAPLPAGAQSGARVYAGLPDLKAVPPQVWFHRTVADDAGELLRVVTFEGALLNDGAGSLDLLGNPQVVGGVKQRVYDGESWSEVGAPDIVFETSDDHNHFHLLGAVDYTVWDEGQLTELATASKVGFCLSDVIQVDPEIERYYSDERVSGFCAQDNPDATELRMGITPGWTDVYGPSVTLQWVDISNTAPGRYWIGAEADPRDQIVESDDSNNGGVFSTSTFTADGWVALPIEVESMGADTPIALSARPYGIVGPLEFVVTEAPAHGSLNVPVGASVRDATVLYTPNPGYEGTDSFSFVARDSSSLFPREPAAATVRIEVTANDAANDDDTDDDAVDGATSTASEIEVVGVAEVSQYDSFDLQFSVEAGSEPADLVRWFGSGLPPGASIDVETGAVTGVASTPGVFEATVHAVGKSATAELDIMFQVDEPDDVRLTPVNDLNAPALVPFLNVFVGVPRPMATYEATGLPPGLGIVASQPQITGTPEEVGTFDVVITESVDGEVVATASFRLTIRPSAIPRFLI